MRALRKQGGLSQRALAEKMQALGHPLYRQTIADIESNRRTVVVDELVGLALALNRTIAELLDPAGGDGPGKPGEPISVDGFAAPGWYVGAPVEAEGEGGPPSPTMPWTVARVVANSAGPVHLEGETVRVPVNPSTLRYLGRPVDRKSHPENEEES